MANPLTKKTAVVTGATSGIGAAIAEELLNAGANVVLAGRNEEKLIEKKNELNMDEKILYVKTDMTKEEDVIQLKKETINKFGNIDIYVNNAGVMKSSSVVNGAVTEWEQMIDTNIKGVLYGINSILPEMLENESGHIFNIASDLGFDVLERSTVYSATKFAVRVISMGLEKELAKTGVRISNVSPGMVETKLSSESPFDSRGKKLEPKDIGRAVVMLQHNLIMWM